MGEGVTGEGGVLREMKPAKTEPYLPGRRCFELWVLACTGPPKHLHVYPHTHAHTWRGRFATVHARMPVHADEKRNVVCRHSQKGSTVCCRKEVKRGYWPRIWQRRSLCSFHAFSKGGGRCGSHYHSFLTAPTKDRKCLGVRKNTSFLRAQLCTSGDFSWGIKGIFQAVSSSLFKTSAAKHLPILFSLLSFFFFFALICIFYSTNQIWNIYNF